MASLALAYLAGLLTIINPCVLPLAPVVVASARAEDPRGPLALAAGLALTFGIVGGLIASFGAELGESLALRLAAGALLMAFGLAMTVPPVGHLFERMLAPMVGFGNRLSQGVSGAGLFGQAILGALLALAWGPCVGPTLGAALVLAAGNGTLPVAMISMAIFALGAATSLLLAGYGLGRLTRHGRGVARSSANAGRIVFGIVLLAVGVLMVTGLDRHLEAAIVEVMPDWLVRFATRV